MDTTGTTVTVGPGTTEDADFGYLTREEVIDLVGRAYFESMFEDLWANLAEAGIDKALHRQCSETALKALAELMRQNPSKRLDLVLQKWFR